MGCPIETGTLNGGGDIGRLDMFDDVGRFEDIRKDSFVWGSCHLQHLKHGEIAIPLNTRRYASRMGMDGELHQGLTLG